MLMDNNATQQNNTILDTPITPTETPAPQPEGKVIKKKSKAGLIIGIIIGIILLAGGAVAAVIIITNNKRVSWHKEVATEIIEKITSGKSEKSVFFESDIENFAEKIKKTPYAPYSQASYATKYNDKVYICLDNGSDKVSGEAGNLTVVKISDKEPACKYELKDDEKEAYLYNYITRKYGYLVDKDKTKTEKDKYVITTDQGAIYAAINQVGNEIKVSDDQDTLTKDYSNVDNLFEIVNDRSLTYANATKFDSSTEIIEVKIAQDTKNNIIMVQSVFNLTEAKQYLEYMSEYLKGKPVKDGIVGVTRYRWTDDGKIATDYIVGLYITNGEHQIKVISQSEKAESKD